MVCKEGGPNSKGAQEETELQDPFGLYGAQCLASKKGKNNGGEGSSSGTSGAISHDILNCRPGLLKRRREKEKNVEETEMPRKEVRRKNAPGKKPFTHRAPSKTRKTSSKENSGNWTRRKERCNQRGPFL